MNAKLQTTNFSDIVSALLRNIPEREADVLAKRNALGDYPKQTLESIGKSYHITRERVRQIENEGIKKIKSIDYDKLNIPVSILGKIVSDHISSTGGLISESHLMDNLLADVNENVEKESSALEFILSYVLSETFQRVKPHENIDIVWATEEKIIEELVEAAHALHDLIEKTNEPLTLSAIHNSFKSNKSYKNIDEKDADNESILEALLRAHLNLDSNILGEWGQKQWKTITPKRMTDKAYLILKRENKPLHFEEITDLINQANFDQKKACAATVHNELILDDKYVLVGRGLYALREHGFSEGTVADIIAQLLKENGPLDKQKIADEVLKQRFVQKTTITLALMKKDKFSRLTDGRYELVK